MNGGLGVCTIGQFGVIEQFLRPCPSIGTDIDADLMLAGVMDVVL
jgi:hypothetical protein